MTTSFNRLRDEALLDHIDAAIDAAEQRGLDQDLIGRLGERVRNLMIEREARKAAAGAPSLFEALPSVVEAREGAA